MQILIGFRDGLPLTLCLWLVVRGRQHEPAEQRISLLL